MKPLAKIFCGFVGALSLIFQPIMAALFSGAFVLAALVIGLPLRAPRIRDAWSRVGWWALLISAAALAVLIFHAKLGLEGEGVDPETNEKIKMISPIAAVLGYFFAIFPVVNLPQKRPNKAPEPTPMSVTPLAAQEPRRP